MARDPVGSRRHVRRLPGSPEAGSGSRICLAPLLVLALAAPTHGPEHLGPTAIVLAAGIDPPRLTSPQRGVALDVDDDGRPELISWTPPRSRTSFLVLDRDGNGSVDPASELTRLSADGSRNLARLLQLDDPDRGGNGDGMLSSADRHFDRLWTWVDRDHDGRSRRIELVPLAMSGIDAIDLADEEWDFEDGYGNRFRRRATLLRRLRVGWLDVGSAFEVEWARAPH
ncbi:MAG: hypothetical protein R3190_00065 [Thermoanaerobaculia bacterium]|nr:hypothetical protein [Thermoanaerobaculia bacterium]